MAVFVIFLLTKSKKRLYALRALIDDWIPDQVGNDKLDPLGRSGI